MNPFELGTKLKSSFLDADIILPVKELGEGYASEVVESKNGLVFKIAKNHRVQKTYKREHTLLKLLSSKIKGFDIPYPEYYIESSNSFPYGLLGYKKIEGEILDPEKIRGGNLRTIASRIADFLLQIHSIDTSSPEITDLGLETCPPPLEEIKHTWINVSDWLRSNLNEEEYFKMHDFWKEAELFLQSDMQPVRVVHGDIWFENILTDKESHVVGVIDFGNVKIGDIAIDFAVHNYVSNQFRDEVINQYIQLGGEVGENLKKRMDYLLAVREIYGLKYGIMIDDIDEDTLAKIREMIYGIKS